MKYRTVNRMLNRFASHPVRSLKHAMYIIIAAGVIGNGLSSCGISLSGTKTAIENAVNDSGLQEVYESVSDTLNDIDFSSEDGKVAAENAVRSAQDATVRCSDVTMDEVILVRVVDGDTLVVHFKDSTEDEKIRLIGVNTPESVAPDTYRTKNTAEGETASKYVKKLLKDIDTVYLQSDTSDTDKYGRLLRYVWLDIPEDAYDMDEVKEKMLNAILVDKGVAEAITYEPDTMYEDYFNELDLD